MKYRIGSFFFAIFLASISAQNNATNDTTSTPHFSTELTTLQASTVVELTTAPTDQTSASEKSTVVNEHTTTAVDIASTEALGTTQEPTKNGTTTVGPSPTTVAPSSTTVAPTTPKTGNWTWKSNDKICIMVQAGLRLQANYTYDHNNKTSFTWNFPNDNRTASGKCGSNTSMIVLDGQEKFGHVTIDFEKDDAGVKVSKISLSHSHLPHSNKSWTFTLGNQKLFQAKMGNSYLCKSEQTFTLNGTVNGTVAEVMIYNLQVQAFIDSKQAQGSFGDAQECPADAQTSNIVPIAVGAALAALVVIVLVAYLISRNRNKRGYESV